MQVFVDNNSILCKLRLVTPTPYVMASHQRTRTRRNNNVIMTSKQRRDVMVNCRELHASSGTNFIAIWTKLRLSLIMLIHLKTSFAKWRPFWWDLYVVRCVRSFGSRAHWQSWLIAYPLTVPEVISSPARARVNTGRKLLAHFDPRVSPEKNLIKNAHTHPNSPEVHFSA